MKVRPFTTGSFPPQRGTAPPDFRDCEGPCDFDGRIDEIKIALRQLLQLAPTISRGIRRFLFPTVRFNTDR